MKKLIPFLVFILFVTKAMCQSPCSDSVEVSICVYNNSGDISTYKHVELFDSLKNTISKIDYTLTNNHWAQLSGNTYQYSYDGFGHIITYKQMGFYGFAFPRNQYFETYIYDSPTHESEHSMYHWNGSAWVDNIHYIFYSNAAGDDTLKVQESGDTLGWHNYERTYSFYNNDHLSVHDSMQSWNGTWWLRTETFTSYSGTRADSILQINYNSAGTIINQSYSLQQFDSSTMYMYDYGYYWNGTAWIGGLSDSVLYDSSGHVLQSNYGEFIQYAYDSLGNIIYYHYQGNGQSSGDEGYYYVNGVLRSSSGNYSTQGGFISSSSCDFRYADISASATTCGSNLAVLSAQPCTPGNQYFWSTSETTQTIIGTVANSYTVTVTYPDGFSDSSFAFMPQYSPPVQLDLGPDTTLCVTQNILLQAGNGFKDYLWQDSSSFSTFLVSDSISGTLYCSVIVVDSVGCIASDSVSIVFDICAEINQAEKIFFTISPNPAISRFEISTGKSTFNLLEIFNTFSEKIYSKDYHEGLTVNCELFSPGIYLVRLSDSEKQLTQKLVVE